MIEPGALQHVAPWEVRGYLRELLRGLVPGQTLAFDLPSHRVDAPGLPAIVSSIPLSEVETLVRLDGARVIDATLAPPLPGWISYTYRVVRDG